MIRPARRASTPAPVCSGGRQAQVLPFLPLWRRVLALSYTCLQKLMVGQASRPALLQTLFGGPLLHSVRNGFPVAQVRSRGVPCRPPWKELLPSTATFISSQGSLSRGPFLWAKKQGTGFVPGSGSPKHERILSAISSPLFAEPGARASRCHSMRRFADASLLSVGTPGKLEPLKARCLTNRAAAVQGPGRPVRLTAGPCSRHMHKAPPCCAENGDCVPGRYQALSPTGRIP